MRFEPRSRCRSVLTAGLQALGVLGTSHLLDFILRRTPGYAASRAARILELGGGRDSEALGLIFLEGVVGAAILEELLFRGILFEGLRRTLGQRVAIVGSAACFGLAHLDLHQGLAATLLGLQLAALRAHFGLLLAVVAHVLNNAAALTATLLGLEATAISLALAALLSCAACAELVQRSNRGGRLPDDSGNARSTLQRGLRMDE